MNGSSKLVLVCFWIITLLLTGFISYGYGKAAIKVQNNDEKVLSAQSNQPASIQDPAATPEITGAAPMITLPAAKIDSQTNSEINSCTKTGFAQKWEYLTPYVLKANDSLQSIATDQLHDATRVDELLQLNGVGPLVIGSTLYLPPPSIKKSSGKIKQVYGKLVEKNATAWHISFTNDTSGQGILIPSFLFNSVSNAATFNIGDCLSILLDDGYKIYTLASQ